MSRYTVAENQFGYEVNGSTLRYTVLDNKPDKIDRWSARDREFQLQQNLTVPDGYFRQIAFCAHREDAENLAKAMNAIKGAT